MSTETLKAVATGAVRPEKKGFPGMIDQLKKQVALAAPKHLNPDRMARIALTEFNKNKALAECEPVSIFASVIMASQLGLEPGVNGQGYLIPYKGRCQFVPGWKGLVDLAQRSGRSSVWTGAVFEGDEFEFRYGSDPMVRHVPAGEFDQAKLTHVYAVGRVRGAEYPIIEVWPMAKVWKHRDRFNKVGTRHYSYEHPEMYARKVALLQVLKYLPSSIELQTAMQMETAAETTGQNLNLGDALEGTFSTVQEEPPAAEAMTDEAAMQLLREAGSKDDLAAAWGTIVGNFNLQGRPIPVTVEALRNDRKESIK